MPHLGVDSWGTYDEHGNVAPKPKTEDEQRAANERAQVEQVFGLTGGELMDVAWVPNYPRSITYYVGSVAFQREQPEPFTFTYWYQGVPEYVQSEYDASAIYRTVCENETFGQVPETVTDDEGTWRVVARYRNSGETECPYIGEANAPRPSEFNPCSLCESDGSDDGRHGVIYIGDGWAEIVYRLQEAPEVYGELAIQEHVSERGQRYVDTATAETTFTIDIDRNERARALRMSCDAGRLAVTLPRYAVNEMTQPSHEVASFWLRVWDVLYALDTGNRPFFS